MPTIKLETFIQSDLQTVFDLSRSIKLHTISTKETNEKAIAGKTEGLLELNEWVTWHAKHFGIYWKLTSKITKLQFPHYFIDEMITGVFKKMHHEHIFHQSNDGVQMIDVFNYTSPLGRIGRCADRLFVKKHLHALLLKRNQTIKENAERENV